jgi:hypothetical protein
MIGVDEICGAVLVGRGQSPIEINIPGAKTLVAASSAELAYSMAVQVVEVLREWASFWRNSRVERNNLHATGWDERVRRPMAGYNAV